MLRNARLAIGLGHSSEIFGTPYVLREATMFAWCCNPMNEDDIEGIRALYGPPERYTLIIGGVTRE